MADTINQHFDLIRQTRRCRPSGPGSGCEKQAQLRSEDYAELVRALIRTSEDTRLGMLWSLPTMGLFSVGADLKLDRFQDAVIMNDFNPPIAYAIGFVNCHITPGPHSRVLDLQVHFGVFLAVEVVIMLKDKRLRSGLDLHPDIDPPAFYRRKCMFLGHGLTILYSWAHNNGYQRNLFFVRVLGPGFRDPAILGSIFGFCFGF
jgi:hypothetical protein